MAAAVETPAAVKKPRRPSYTRNKFRLCEIRTSRGDINGRHWDTFSTAAGKNGLAGTLYWNAPRQWRVLVSPPALFVVLTIAADIFMGSALKAETDATRVAARIT